MENVIKTILKNIAESIDDATSGTWIRHLFRDENGKYLFQIGVNDRIIVDKIAHEKDRDYICNVSPEIMREVIAYIDRLKSENERLEDELDEFKQEVWPDWADKIESRLRSVGYDARDENGSINLAEAFKDYLSGIEEQEAYEQLKVQNLEAIIGKIRAAAEPFTDVLSNVNGEVDLGTAEWNAILGESLKYEQFSALNKALSETRYVYVVPRLPTVSALEWEFEPGEDIDRWKASDPFNGIYLIERDVHGSYLLHLSDPESEVRGYSSLKLAQTAGYEDYKKRILSVITDGQGATNHVHIAA